MRDTVTPSLLRSFMSGMLDTSGMSRLMIGQLEEIANRIRRRRFRWQKREARAAHYRHNAMLGGGARECRRRMKQIADGRLRPENGLST